MDVERPSMDELAREAAGDDDRGIRCPSCGCRHCPQTPLSVAQTFALRAPKSIRRVRVCRHCGRRFVTTERVVGSG